MSRDPNITVKERLVHAARRWAALEDQDPSERFFDECLRRVGDLTDAIRAYEKHCGLRRLPFKVPRRRTTDANPTGKP